MVRNPIREVLLHFMDVVQFVQKPLVDICHLPYLFNRISTIERGRDSKYSLIGRINKFVIDILDEVVLSIG